MAVGVRLGDVWSRERPLRKACAREVWEETGIHIQIDQLIAIYSNPHRLIEYSDGNRFHLVDLCFAAEAVGGELRTSDETSDSGYFTLVEIAGMNLTDLSREWIIDASRRQAKAFVR
jgi:ADP-ribose pyrophosphatase YjhB (NUDIX family)